MPYTSRPRDLRTFLNDASIKALKCANDARTGMRGSAEAAACARAVSAVLREVREALELQAPWLEDRDQVREVLELVVQLSQPAPFRMALPADELAALIVEEVRGLRARALEEGAGGSGGAVG